MLTLENFRDARTIMQTWGRDLTLYDTDASTRF
jgi:hypothetical protein